MGGCVVQLLKMTHRKFYEKHVHQESPACWHLLACLFIDSFHVLPLITFNMRTQTYSLAIYDSHWQGRYICFIKSTYVLAIGQFYSSVVVYVAIRLDISNIWKLQPEVKWVEKIHLGPTCLLLQSWKTCKTCKRELLEQY